MILLRNGLPAAICLSLLLPPGIAGADWFEAGKTKLGFEYDSQSGQHDLHKFRIGPCIDLSDHSELEFRWARSWNMRTGQRVSDACIVEYTQKF